MSGGARDAGPAPAQIPIPLHLDAAAGREAFQRSASNAAALAAVEGWRAWPRGRMALAGPRGSGKSHLLGIWAAEAGAACVTGTALGRADIPALVACGAVAVEDAAAVAGDAAAETALFHLHNLAEQEGASLLLVARDAPARWGARLPDLASRLGALPLTWLERPDDALLRAAAVKLFEDRQLTAPPVAVQELAALAGADLKALEAAVARIDAVSLAGRRRISAALVRETLLAEAEKNVTNPD